MKLKKIASSASASFLNLIYHGAGTVVHLLLLKSSMGKAVFKAEKVNIKENEAGW